MMSLAECKLNHGDSVCLEKSGVMIQLAGEAKAEKSGNGDCVVQ